MAPQRLAAHAADLEEQPGGFIWRVRRRSPAFQRSISLLVELSTEGLLIAWWVAASGAGGAWVEAAVPIWVVTQAVALGLVVVWEGRGRQAVRVVKLEQDALTLGRTALAVSSVEEVAVQSEGWGPWRTAEMTVTSLKGTALRFAADGDDDASLRTIVKRIHAQARYGA